MFKKASFEDEIYSSMEKQLVSNQLEDNHGFSKIAKAIDCLNAAAEIFEQAAMSEQAEEIIEVLQGLARQVPSKTSSISETHHKKCNCESLSCKHEPAGCKNKAGDKKAMYIGSICDHCAKILPNKYLI
jgi:uncharacterized protein YyaL (SSP411 family)